MKIIKNSIVFYSSKNNQIKSYKALKLFFINIVTWVINRYYYWGYNKLIVKFSLLCVTQTIDLKQNIYFVNQCLCFIII